MELVEALKLQLKPKEKSPPRQATLDPLAMYKNPKQEFLSGMKKKWEGQPPKNMFGKDISHVISGTSHADVKEFKDEAGNPANIPVVNYSQVSTAIDEALSLSLQDPATSTRKPLLIFGPPGIGKSQIVRQESQKFAKKMGRKFVEFHKGLDVEEIRRNAQDYYIFVDIRMGYYDPTELRGVPLINTTDDFISHLTEAWINMLCEPAAAGVIFLDELVQAQIQTRAIGYQISLDRRVAENKFSDFVAVLAASNWGEERGVTSDPLPRALEDRFAMVYLQVTADDWLQWASKSQKIHPDIIGFVSSNKEQNFIDKDAPKRKEQVFATIGPSPRGLEAANDFYIMKLEELDAKEKRGEEVVGFERELSDGMARICGIKWASDFMVYLGYYKKLEWDKFVTDPSIIKRKDQLSYTWTYLTRTVRHLKEQKNIAALKLINTTWDHLNREDQALFANMLTSDPEITNVLKELFPQKGGKELIEGLYLKIKNLKQKWFDNPTFDKPKDGMKSFGEGSLFETEVNKFLKPKKVK